MSYSKSETVHSPDGFTVPYYWFQNQILLGVSASLYLRNNFLQIAYVKSHSSLKSLEKPHSSLMGKAFHSCLLHLIMLKFLFCECCVWAVVFKPVDLLMAEPICFCTFPVALFQYVSVSSVYV